MSESVDTDRLREHAAQRFTSGRAVTAVYDAADEIDRLRAENAKWTESLAIADDLGKVADRDIAALQAEVAELRARPEVVTFGNLAVGERFKDSSGTWTKIDADTGWLEAAGYSGPFGADELVEPIR